MATTNSETTATPPAGLRVRAFVLILASVLASVLANPTRAQTPSTLPETSSTQPVLPSLIVPRTELLPRLDASADDPAWSHAATIPSLQLCVGPQATGLSPTPTQIRLMWDSNNLYIRFICIDRDIYAPFGHEQGAKHYLGDVVEVFLDPLGDHQEFLELGVNPLGGFMDGIHLITTPAISGPDGSLDSKVVEQNAWYIPNFEIKDMHITATTVPGAAQQTWIADIALPAQPMLRRLGLKHYQPMSLRANLLRYDADTPKNGGAVQSVFMAWSPVPWGRPHRCPALMGTLTLVNDTSITKP